jgi:hypothetical protein
MYERLESCGFLCLRGVCRSLSCGGRDERPCTIFEHIPACERGLIEEPLLVACRAIDADGYPTVCGDAGESACSITSQLALFIRPCKPWNYEVLGFPLGTCHPLDADGFPPHCGDTDEQACSIDLQLQLGIPSCKPQHYEEIGLPFGTCRRLDDDGYPPWCGDPDELPCPPNFWVMGIKSCKPGLFLNLLTLKCDIPPIDNEGYPEDCGDDGEIACNIFLQALLGVRACKGGLEFHFGFPDGTCHFVRALEPDLGTNVIVGTSDPDDPIRGYADAHTHMFPNEGFGGSFYAGKPFHWYGVEAALDSCRLKHGIGGLEDIVGNGHDDRLFIGHNTTGWPDFPYWPRWNSINHMTMYHRWLERAHRGGMRLMVMFAVSSEFLCNLLVTPRAAGYTCADMPSVDRQLEATRELVEYIDARSGGKGKGWFQIAESPAEARQLIAQGKLAVVLGIEVDSLFGCRQPVQAARRADPCSRRTRSPFHRATRSR